MMAHKSISFNSDDRWMQLQAEMLEMLLQKEPLADEAENYPWEPSLAEDYFARADTEICWDEWSDSDLDQRASSFFSRLDNSFSTPPSVDRPLANLIPHSWLEQIAAKAKVAANNLSLADRLVECVADLLPNWGMEDLLVLARPLAYSMRDRAISVENLVPRVNDTPWSELSEIEKARLSLVVARYVIDDAV